MGPKWLSDVTQWPSDIVTAPSQESETEGKVRSELFTGAVDVPMGYFGRCLRKI